MLEKYFKFFYFLMKYAYGIRTRSKKGSELNIFRFEGVKVALINDYDNRRVLVWYYKDSTKSIYRTAYHGYHARYLRYLIVNTVKKIQEKPEYFDEVLSKRRSYSFRKEVSYKAKFGIKQYTKKK